MYQGYGLTEASPVISSNSTARHRLGSSGVLVNNMDLKICDDNGIEVPVGEKGEIVIRGGNVMHGYWKNEAATKETIKDGWLHSGDMGYITKDGYLYVLGRFKSLLIADDGENSVLKVSKKRLRNSQNTLTSACSIIIRSLIP
jgi:long-chain acyl-CoA synthetase